MRAPLSTQSIFAYHIIDLPVALDSVQQHDVHRRVSLHLKQLAGYKFQTGSPPTEDPPFKFIFGNMEARLAILRLINVQALTNAAFFYHFRAKYSKINCTLTSIVFGEADSSHGFTHIFEPSSCPSTTTRP